MKFNWKRAAIIARREYVTTVTRKAFILTLLLTPAFYAFLMIIMIKPQADEAIKSLKSFKTMGVVDSSGLLRDAPREIVTTLSSDDNPFQRRTALAPPKVEVMKTEVRFYPSEQEALAALSKHEVGQVVVVPAATSSTGRCGAT